MNSSITPQVNEILRKERLAPSITLFEVHSPLVANAVRAGQFVVVRADDYAERIPLTVVDRDPGRRSITLIVQTVGVSTRKMEKLNVGEVFLDVVGPLGKPTEIKRRGPSSASAEASGSLPSIRSRRLLRRPGTAFFRSSGPRPRRC